MTLSRRLRAAVFTAAVTAGVAAAQVPGQPCPCPPGPFLPAVPYQPGTPAPSAPKPSTPGTQTPGTQAPGTQTPQTNPAQPPSNTPSQPPASSNDALASSTAGQGGGSADASSLPGIFGDLYGGPAVPIAIQRFDARGNPIGVVFNQRVPGTNTFRPVTGVSRATDELLFGQSAAVQPAGTPVASTRIIQDADPSQIIAGTRVPTFNRGQFKITENETPRPTTRAYLTYNFYDNIFKSVGVDTPRVILHQQNFGYEQAFANQQYSVGVRLPYNQIVSPGFYNDTSLGDLTIVTKAVIAENRATGDLLSGGLSLTVPTGSIPNSSFTDENFRGVLLQPYLGYILTNGDVFLQGFSSLVIPTNSADVTLFTQSLALGYTLYRRPCGGPVTGIYPVFEAHLNTPLTDRGDIRTSQAAFPDNLTLLGGTFFELYGRTTLGFAAGAPVTGPRPFSLQATALMSVRF